MSPFAKFRHLLASLGWVERVFALLTLLYGVLLFVAPNSGWILLVQLAACFFAVWLSIRLLRFVARKAIWRLRNRLLITYLFIGGVPILLILTLVSTCFYLLTSQVAVYLVTSELDRRVDALKLAANSIANTEPPNRPDTIHHVNDLFYSERFPGLDIVVRTGGGILRYPSTSKVAPPPTTWTDDSGVVQRGDSFYAWSHVAFDGGDVTVMAPLTAEYLSGIVPNLGRSEFWRVSRIASSNALHIKVGDDNLEIQRSGQPRSTAVLPPPAFGLDLPVEFASFVPVRDYDRPGAKQDALLRVSSRVSAVFRVLFNRKTDVIQGSIPIALMVTAIAFLIVEIIALIVGASMTRTITSAVHHLYRGTQRVMQGDFSQRIEARGRDQLSDLSRSFNVMTERIEGLLTVAKEKERLQAEIEIASEVQNQLFPKTVPSIASMRLTAVCKPARMVSGDYFDYECVRDTQVALAIGDVAGKGISAALLMAALQSSLRAELRNAAGLRHTESDGGMLKPISTACLVGHLNQQLYANTSPEKYATFCLGLYDDETKILRYTNGGHLPPILIRDGQWTRLNVDGTVVGAFSWAEYGESELKLHSGDLLVCFTDGISEPENAYGEMFGEDRLADLVAKNVHLPDSEIISTILNAVEQWTGSPELQDDMTLLLARRI